MPLALTGQELGLAGVAALFIAFALASSFLLPRRNANFPGRAVGYYTVLVAAFTIAMLGAVWYLAEEEEVEAADTAEILEPTPGEESQPPGGETVPSQEDDVGGDTDTGTTAATTAAAEAEGDPAAGKQVFASAGCGGCHTLADAGSGGTIGPNLDEAQPEFELVVDRVTNGMGQMPSFKDQLSEEEIRNVAAYVSEAAGG